MALLGVAAGPTIDNRFHCERHKRRATKTIFAMHILNAVKRIQGYWTKRASSFEHCVGNEICGRLTPHIPHFVIDPLVYSIDPSVQIVAAVY